MAKRLEAARAACGDALLLMARTDALAAHGIEEALSRAERYERAGAQILFIDGVETGRQMEQVRRRAFRAPLKYNNTIKRDREQPTTEELWREGFRLICYSASMQKAAIKGMQGVLEELRANGRTQGYADRKVTQAQRAALLGQARWDACEREYGGR